MHAVVDLDLEIWKRQAEANMFDQFVSHEAEEKYQTVLRLNNAIDPETEPYKSKYKARELLCDLKHDAEKYRNEDVGDERWLYFMSAMDYLLGVNYVDTEELPSGQEHLLKSIEVLQPNKIDERACNLLQCAYNQLGILWTGRRQNEKVTIDF